MVFQVVLVYGNIIANYRYIVQYGFIKETILMEVFSLLQKLRFCPILKSAVLSRIRNRRRCLIFEIGGFVSFKTDCFVLPPVKEY